MRGWSPETIALILGLLTTLSVALIGALATGAVRIINALKGVETKVDALEIKVDGRLTQLLERTASSSRAEGVVVGRGEMSTVPIPQVTAPVEASQPQADGTLVIGVPNNPTPAVLLLPVEDKGEKEKKEDG